jgi:hypothetical protein
MAEDLQDPQQLTPAPASGSSLEAVTPAPTAIPAATATPGGRPPSRTYPLPAVFPRPWVADPMSIGRTEASVTGPKGGTHCLTQTENDGENIIGNT